MLDSQLREDIATLERGLSLRGRVIRALSERVERLEEELAMRGGSDSSDPVQGDDGGRGEAWARIRGLLDRLDRLEGQRDRLESELIEARGLALEGSVNDAVRPLLRIREAVGEHVPREAAIAVVNQGVEDLLLLQGRQARPFPTGTAHRGRPDAPKSTDLIEELEDARRNGANFLLIPSSSDEWLSGFDGFADYLSQRYPAIARDENCVIHSLGFPHTAQPRSVRKDQEATTNRVVSVILPVYNGIRPHVGDRWLHETIRSVIHQGGISLELVIVDDGSVDGTEHVLAGYDDRAIVNVITLQKWRGFGAAVNIGAEAASGGFLARISVGDRFLPGKLAAQLKALADGQLDLVGCGVQETAESGTKDERRLYPESDESIRAELLERPALFPSSLLMRRDVWSQTGGYSTDPRFRFAEDYEFLVRAASHPARYRFGSLQAVLCESRPSSDRVSRSPLTRDLHERALVRVRSQGERGLRVG